MVDGRYDVSALTSADPILAELFSMANDVGFRLGTWGGASRDFLLGRGAPPAFSDVDMVYDSGELWSALTRDGVLGFVKKLGRIGKGYWNVVRMGGPGAVTRYTMLDRNPDRSLTMSVHDLMASGAETLNQVALQSDGSVWDPSGGLADLQAGLLRYRAPRPVSELAGELDDIHNAGPYDVLRAIRFKVQYPELRFAPGTEETLHEIMRLYAPGTPYAAEVAGYAQGAAGKVRTALPFKTQHLLAATRNALGHPDRRDIRVYMEKGLKKILDSTPDPRESLRLLEQFGVARLARDSGLGEYLEALEAKAAAGAGGALPVDPGAGGAARGSSEQGEALAGTAWRNVRDQAYRNYLAATARGDLEAARLQFELYQRAGAATP